jgi:hypothetical protein
MRDESWGPSTGCTRTDIIKLVSALFVSAATKASIEDCVLLKMLA